MAAYPDKKVLFQIFLYNLELLFQPVRLALLLHRQFSRTFFLKKVDHLLTFFLAHAIFQTVHTDKFLVVIYLKSGLRNAVLKILFRLFHRQPQRKSYFINALAVRWI